MRKLFTQTHLLQLNQAIDYYSSELYNNIIFFKSTNSVTKWLEKIEKRIAGLPFPESWLIFDIYCFSQVWPSTSRGWGGFGGAALTMDYTTVIHNPDFGIIAVFWGGHFAYAVNDTDEVLALLKEKKLPGLKDIERFDFIFINYKSEFLNFKK